MNFLDVKRLNDAGNITTFRPWMGAVIAASMQAVGFYKAIVRKSPNISAAFNNVADFKSTKTTDSENALKSGLLPLKFDDTQDVGGNYYWTSDQTCYTRDSNFVFNSIQAMYAMDTISQTVSSLLEQSFTGESLADFNAVSVKLRFDEIMKLLRDVKLIAPSDDAPLGYKEPTIKIAGPVTLIECDVKLATANYFTRIRFGVGQVTQTA
jgi:hypothetical protein